MIIRLGNFSLLEGVRLFEVELLQRGVVDYIHVISRGLHRIKWTSASEDGATKQYSGR